MKIAVVGATGLVGTKMLQILQERKFPVTELLVVASAKSVGKQLEFAGKTVTVIGMEAAIEAKPQIAIFSAGGDTSLEWAPKFAAAGITVIDNSSAWRMNPNNKLVIPEVNANVLTKDDKIIANPNCSTIQMLLVLQPLHLKYGIERVVVSTYQSVTGTGAKAVSQMMNERNGIEGEMAYQLTATCVRIPTMGGHSESLNIELKSDFTIEDIKQLLSEAPGVVLQDDTTQNLYPMPLTAHESDDTFVGRIRKDETRPNTFNCWVVSDNLRKGAATNAVQIAEYLVEKGLV